MANTKTYWTHALDRQRQRLADKRHATALSQLDFDSFKDFLSAESQRYTSRSDVRLISRLGPILDDFNSYVRSITTIVQGGGAVACFVWGAVQAVLTVSRAMHEIPGRPS